MALLLVTWRIVRCNPLTPIGTCDEVAPASPRRRRRVAAVLALSAMTTLLVAGSASAASTLRADEGATAVTAGGCTATVGGVPIGALDRDHPLQVHKGQNVVLSGRAPAAKQGLPASQAQGITSQTVVKIHIIEKIGASGLNETSRGLTFGRTVKVDKYLKYGSGLYRVDVSNDAGNDWQCSATFFVELHGSKLAAEAAVVVGAIGAVGMIGAGGGGEPDPGQYPGEPEDSIKVQDITDGSDPKPQPELPTKSRDKLPDLASLTGAGCLLIVLVSLCLGAFSPGGAFGLAVPVPGRRPARRVWVRGRPVLGVISGLFCGIGLAVAAQQLGWTTLNVISAIVFPLGVAVIGGVRGWRGRPWRVS
jgi:hypothetical protein